MLLKVQRREHSIHGPDSGTSLKCVGAVAPMTIALPCVPPLAARRGASRIGSQTFAEYSVFSMLWVIWYSFVPLGERMGEIAETVLCRNSEVIHAPVGTEELIMLGIDAGRYYSVNPVGRYVWELLEQPRTIPELCSAVCAEFEVDAQACEADIVKFVREMMDNALIHAASA